MKKLKVILSIIALISCSCSKTVYKEVLTYHKLTKEQKRINGKVIREKFSVNKKTKLKHGLYERYDLNFLTLEQGYYKNGVRSGIWKIWHREDQIFIEKDYDNSGEETPLIEKGYLKYPIVLVEDRDTLPEGLINMKLLFDNECRLISLEILEGIDKEFNTKIANEYNRYARLCKKYDLPIKECIENQGSLLINFTL